MGFSWAVGYTLPYFVGMLLEGTNPHAWRWILASSAIPALISVPLRLAAPESPLWLAGSAAKTRLRAVFASQHRPATLVASILFFCLVVPYFAVGTFIPQVMAALPVTGNEVAGLIYILLSYI